LHLGDRIAGGHDVEIRDSGKTAHVPQPDVPGFFVVGPAGGQAGGGQTISTYRDEARKCDRHEIEAAWDCKAVAPLMGAFFSEVA
jgi:hypothetical protein